MARWCFQQGESAGPAGYHDVLQMTRCCRKHCWTCCFPTCQQPLLPLDLSTTCGKVMPGPASCLSVFGGLTIRIVAEPALSSCWKYTVLPEPTTIGEAPTVLPRPASGKDNTFVWLKVSTLLPRPAEVPTVLPGPASAVAGQQGQYFHHCWKFQQCCQANILPPGRHETSDKATAFLLWKVSTVLPGRASCCHLQDIKLLAGSQSQQCITWKASNLWQGDARASIVSSLCSFCLPPAMSELVF